MDLETLRVEMENVSVSMPVPFSCLLLQLWRWPYQSQDFSQGWMHLLPCSIVRVLLKSDWHIKASVFRHLGNFISPGKQSSTIRFSCFSLGRFLLSDTSHFWFLFQLDGGHETAPPSMLGQQRGSESVNVRGVLPTCREAPPPPSHLHLPQHTLGLTFWPFSPWYRKRRGESFVELPCKKIEVYLGQMFHQGCLLVLGFCTKLYTILVVSESSFSRAENWTTLGIHMKLGTLVHHTQGYKSIYESMTCHLTILWKSFFHLTILPSCYLLLVARRQSSVARRERAVDSSSRLSQQRHCRSQGNLWDFVRSDRTFYPRCCPLLCSDQFIVKKFSRSVVYSLWRSHHSFVNPLPSDKFVCKLAFWLWPLTTQTRRNFCMDTHYIFWKCIKKSFSGHHRSVKTWPYTGIVMSTCPNMVKHKNHGRRQLTTKARSETMSASTYLSASLLEGRRTVGPSESSEEISGQSHGTRWCAAKS